MSKILSQNFSFELAHLTNIFIYEYSHIFARNMVSIVVLHQISFIDVLFFSIIFIFFLKFQHDFFKCSLTATAAYKRAHECVNLLQCWKASYMETRAYIENSGNGSRWEFDKKILFGLVDHVSRISQDIADIAKVKKYLLAL